MKKRYVFGLLAIAIIGMLALSFWLIRRETPAMRELRAKCDAINVGMTRREVAELLGRPPETSSFLQKIWYYPEGCIWVSFDKGGTVTDKGFKVWHDLRTLLTSFGKTVVPPASNVEVLFQAIDDFLDDIGTGNVEMAYASTTAEFQQKYTMEELRTLVARYPVLDHRDSWREYTWSGPGPGPFPPGPTVKIPLTVSTERGSVSVSLTLKKRGMWWEPDEMVVAPLSKSEVPKPVLRRSVSSG